MRAMVVMGFAKLSVAAMVVWITARLVMTAIKFKMMAATISAAAPRAVMVVWIRVKFAMTVIVSKLMPVATIVWLRLAAMVFVAKISLLVRRVMRLVMTAIEFRPMRA